MKDSKMIVIPDWVKRVIKNSKAREKYFIKRYQSLERMYNRDKRFIEKLDNDDWLEEQKRQQ